MGFCHSSCSLATGICNSYVLCLFFLGRATALVNIRADSNYLILNLALKLMTMASPSWGELCFQNMPHSHSI